MDDQFLLKNVKKALIVGSGHGIGFSLSQFLIENSDAHIFALYRSEAKSTPLKKLSEMHPERISIQQIDLLDEKRVEQYFQNLKNQKITFDLSVNCLGLLHNEVMGPEKSLRDIELESLVESFKVNAASTLLLAKHLKPCLDRKKVWLFASLSAMVGSIEDNSSGGWYAYRGSKAALNMFIKNIGLEFKRSFPHAIVLALHPGTTDTELSRPFSQNVKHKIWTTSETAGHLMSVFEGKSAQDSGRFYNWDNSQIPW